MRAVRAFGGYAGWSAGQLEDELAEEAWIEADAQPGDVFTEEPDRLWSRVLDRKGGSYRLVARMPEDPSLN
jgi:putative transcriptional regulator